METRKRARGGWLFLLIATLNYHWGLGSARLASQPLFGPASPAQYAAIVRLGAAADVMSALSPDAVASHDWSVELGRAAVSYEGEEVSTAEPLCQARVAPTVPPAGVAGSIDLLPLTEGFLFEALQNPALTRLAESEVDDNWPRPRLNMEHGEDGENFMVWLHELGLLTVIDEEEIWTHKGLAVLNGMFGVIKATPQHKRIRWRGALVELLRLIMNLVPSNSLQHRLDADIDLLPYSGQWAATHLLAYEMFLGSERDRFCYFYIYRLPAVWRGSMAFCQTVAGWRVGHPDRRRVHLASIAPGMGWLSAVGVTEQAHRRMLRTIHAVPRPVGLSDQSLLPVFRDALEVRKNRPFPLNGLDDAKAAWAVYIDNLSEDEIWHESEVQHIVGVPSASMRAADERYDHWNSPASLEKAADRVIDRTQLGIRTHGALGRRDTPRGYLPKLISVTLWILRHPSVSRRWLQVIAGRWVRQMSLRPATYMCFKHLWRWISKPGRLGPVPDAVAVELVSAICLSPLMHTNLRDEISPEVSATDASMGGGGVCRSTGLADSGLTCGSRMLEGPEMKSCSAASSMGCRLSGEAGSCSASAAPAS